MGAAFEKSKTATVMYSFVENEWNMFSFDTSEMDLIGEFQFYYFNERAP